MTGAAAGLAWLIAIFVAISLLWRLFSQRRTLPCPSWLGWMVERENPFARTHRADFIVRQMRLDTGMQVLDAGCGPGRLSLPLALAVGPEGEVVAADLQAGMLARVDAKARQAGIDNICTRMTALGQGTLESKRYDRVVMAAVLGEIPDQGAALAELFVSLKPGGLLAVAELIFDPHFQRRSHVRAQAEAAGFREKAHFGHAIAYLTLFERPTGH
ncbi:class I SAM-dependent methyltransferase [Propionivibrio dicarboxylicus]|uniref:Methyltransferase domain-containing protein n=1 Tax=Propionivibrio dicarboxylicus TaxID=83767 RepID=A0A1G7VQY7_9RHOO|nr:class I SAM-dependent methyltransferase [Propionivibrio dicarboxylicus]SDG62236.1 Methyltransferase domain-containing protein [Propionivibrio dicarboxylicus]